VSQKVPLKSPNDGNSTYIIANGQKVDADCNGVITVDCIRQLYNAVGMKPSNGGRNGNRIGVTAYLNLVSIVV
jgi:tripeptidyl-peptidase-1